MTRENIPELDYSKAGFGKSQNEEGCAGCGKKASKGWALYCVKCIEPVREWQGLTDEDRQEIERWIEFKEAGGNDPVPTQKIITYVEAKLKEKNA